MNYLKKVFLLLSFFCLTFTIQAQISIGPKLGINLATKAGNNVTGGSGRLPGLQFGLATEFELGIGGTFAIQTELLFFQKGSKGQIETPEEPITTKSYLNYLEAPILAKLLVFSAGNTDFIVTVGPSFGYAINGNTVIDGEKESIDFEAQQINRFEISAAVGAGIQFSVGSGNLFLDTRYLLGLSNNIKSSRNLDIKNRGFGFAIGFLIPVGDE